MTFSSELLSLIFSGDYDRLKRTESGELNVNEVYYDISLDPKYRIPVSKSDIVLTHYQSLVISNAL